MLPDSQAPSVWVMQTYFTLKCCAVIHFSGAIRLPSKCQLLALRDNVNVFSGIFLYLHLIVVESRDRQGMERQSEGGMTCSTGDSNWGDCSEDSASYRMPQM